MASALLSRRVEKVVAYPPLCDMSDHQRRDFQEVLLDADAFEDLPGKWQAAIEFDGNRTTGPGWLHRETARRQRAKADTKSLMDWKIDVARALVAGVLTVGGVALLDMPDGLIGQVIAIGLFMVGVVLVLSAEYGWNYLMADGRIAMDEVERLREENAGLRATRGELEGEL